MHRIDLLGNIFLKNQTVRFLYESKLFTLVLSPVQFPEGWPVRAAYGTRVYFKVYWDLVP